LIARINDKTGVFDRLSSIKDIPPETELKLELDRDGSRLTKRVVLASEYKYLAKTRADVIRKWSTRSLGELSDGSDARLASFKGTPMIIFVWATYCGPCKAVFATLQMIADRYREPPIPIVCVSVDDDPAMRTKYLKRNKLPGMQYLSREFPRDLTITHLPTIIIVSPDFEVVPELDPHFLPWVAARFYQHAIRPG